MIGAFSAPWVEDTQGNRLAAERLPTVPTHPCDTDGDLRRMVETLERTMDRLTSPYQAEARSSRGTLP